MVFSRNYSNSLYDKILGLYTRHGLTPRLFVTNMEPHDEAGAVTVASGKTIFMGAGASVNRSLAGVDLVSIRLKEPEAKIEVYAACRRDEAAPAVYEFLDCARSLLPRLLRRPRAGAWSTRVSLPRPAGPVPARVARHHGIAHRSKITRAASRRP